jgi:signal transduction histidine kinase/ActR/RegA family two-component response regulator
VPSTIVPNIVVGAFLVWIMHDHVPALRLWSWFSLLVIFQLTVPRGMMQRYLADIDSVGAAPRWARAFAWQATTNGMIWGVAAAIFFTPEAPVHLALLCALLCGMSAGAIPVTAMLLPAFYGAVTAMLLPLIARAALTGEADFMALSGMVAVYWVYTLSTGHSHNRLFRASFRQNLENIGLIGRLVEQTALAESAKEMAVDADRSKSRFLAAASHDLRQPLHAIALFSNALAENTNPAEMRQLAGNLNASVDALSRLLNTLLDISKLDAGAVVPRPRSFAMADLFERLYNDFGPLAAQQGLRLRMRPTAAVVATDPILLEQVLRNLMSNALRYTPQGTVLVACRRRGDDWCIEVRDSGIGIDAQEHAKIFGEYYQIGNAERDRDKGLGLGLAIVDRMAKLIDCPVELRSAPGRGSVFALRVKAGIPAPAAAQSAAPQTCTLAGMRILVIDDESDILAATGAQLRSWQCDVLAAESLEQALERMEARAWIPDGVISDLRLGHGRNGIEVLDCLRDRHGAELRCVLVTGDTGTGQLQAVRQSGYAVLHKPVRPAKLRALLSQWAAERRATPPDSLAA